MKRQMKRRSRSTQVAHNPAMPTQQKHKHTIITDMYNSIAMSYDIHGLPGFILLLSLTSLIIVLVGMVIYFNVLPVYTAINGYGNFLVANGQLPTETRYVSLDSGNYLASQPFLNIDWQDAFPMIALLTTIFLLMGRTALKHFAPLSNLVFYANHALSFGLMWCGFSKASVLALYLTGDIFDSWFGVWLYIIASVVCAFLCTNILIDTFISLIPAWWQLCLNIINPGATVLGVSDAKRITAI